MFDNPEIKGLRQDIDGLTEQVALMRETLEVRHVEILAKLEILEEVIADALEQEVTQDDINDIKATVEQTNDEITELTETVQNIDVNLEKAKTHE